MPIENPVYMLIGESDAGPEQDIDLKVEDLRTIGEKGARVTLRLPTRVYNYIAGLAHSNRRSFAAEVQAALEAHEALSRLSALMDQDLQRARQKASGGQHGVVGETAERMSETIRRDLSNIWAASFGVTGASAAFGAALGKPSGADADGDA